MTGTREQDAHIAWRPLPQSFRDEAQNHSQVILLETSRRALGAKSYLFLDPIEVLEPSTPDDLFRMFERMDAETAQGRWVAGYVAYEAGYAFEPKLRSMLESGQRLAWIAIFASVQIFDHASTGDWNAYEADCAITNEEPNFSETLESYSRKVNQVRDWIAAGETYQANLSMEVRWHGVDARRTFEAAMQAQPVEYGAWLHLGNGEEIISASPELFFRRDGNAVCTRPMKGTAPRGRWLEEDCQNIAELARDEKNCAENLMIVDLLRNDLGRLCRMGSVEVDRMFAVESFPTVLQMTSDVSGTLRDGVGSREIFRALFPSGSIVGAPKIRTMELLHKLEQRRRGVYTGAIGWQGPGAVAAWSVAIRTIHLRDGEQRMGVGSGIVWDSNAKSEFEECRTKCAFLNRKREPFELIETMLWDGQYERLDLHVARIRRSAVFFDMPFDEDAMREALSSAAPGFQGSGRWRVRLTMTAGGDFQVTARALPQTEPQPLRLLLVRERTSPADTYLFHKTTRRKVYNAALERARTIGCADALFCNEVEEITEGAIHNVFVQIDDELVTPLLSCGLLPGVFRGEWLERGLAREARLTVADLQQATAMIVTNSVRGACEVAEVLAEDETGQVTRLWRSDRITRNSLPLGRSGTAPR